MSPTIDLVNTLPTWSPVDLVVLMLAAPGALVVAVLAHLTYRLIVLASIGRRNVRVKP